MSIPIANLRSVARFELTSVISDTQTLKCEVMLDVSVRDDANGLAALSINGELMSTKIIKKGCIDVNALHAEVAEACSQRFKAMIKSGKKKKLKDSNE